MPPFWRRMKCSLVSICTLLLLTNALIIFFLFSTMDLGVSVMFPASIKSLRFSSGSAGRGAAGRAATSSALAAYEPKLAWMSRLQLPQAPRLMPGFQPSAPLFGSWDPICLMGPAASPAIWQSSKPIILSLAYPGWLGVYTAAQGMGPVMGTYLDFSESHRGNLLALLQDTPSLRSVVIHGVPPGSLELAVMLHTRMPSLRLYFVYHGTLSSPIHVQSGEANLLANVVDLSRRGMVHSVGTVKYGFHETLLALGAQRALTVPNFPVVLPHLLLNKYSERDGKLHIGVMAASAAAHKNLIAQLTAACIHPNAVVHVTTMPEGVDYLSFCKAEIVATGLLPHNLFTVEVTRMDVILYVSLVECFPMLVLESAAAGIPILVSRTHHIFDSSPVLDAALVVAEADNPSEITRRLAHLADPAVRAELRPHLLALAGCMQRRAELGWTRLLELSSKERQQLDFLRDLDSSALLLATDESVCTSSSSSANSRSLVLAGKEAAAAATAAVAAAAGSSSSSGSGGRGAGAGAGLLKGSLRAAVQEALRVVAPSAASKFRVALVTYELPPFLPGGAGVVIFHLIEELLQQGHGVTVLAHMDAGVLDKWAALMRSKGWDSNWDGSSSGSAGNFTTQLLVHHVPSFAAEAKLLAHPCSPKHLFLQRASIFAEAAAKAFSLAPFDLLECFDYAGVAFDLVRRLRRWQESPGTSQAPHLPPHLPIVVRLHGSIQLIHQSEGLLSQTYGSTRTPPPCSSQDDATAWPLMYLMERYAMAGAHAVLAQSLGMAGLYQAAYGLSGGELRVAHPPMTQVLKDFVGAVQWGGGPAIVTASGAVVYKGGRAGGGSGSDSLGSDGATPGAFRLLVYGRIARMKGSETVAQAVAGISAGLPPGTPLDVSFVGLDWGCPIHGRPTSECVEAALAEGMAGGAAAIEVTFENSIERGALPALVQGYHAGIIASEFETFNLAAHELAACGLPLVVSDIPALREFFTAGNAYPFQAGSAASLVAAVLALFQDTVAGRAKVAQLEYGDPLEPYRALVALSREDPAASAAHDTSDLSATDFAIGAQSRDCFASYECKRLWMGEVEPEEG